MLRRLAQSVFVVAATYVLVYFVLFLLPGDPIQSRIDNPLNPIPEDQAQAILAYYHLDAPALEQFRLAVVRAVQGDFGYSLTSGRPVADLMAQGIGQTVTLASIALVFAVALALAVALAAVYAPLRSIRSFFRTLPVVMTSTPGFLVGLLLLQIFAYQLGWFSSIRDEGFKSLILPAVALAIGVNAPIAQVLIQGLDRSAKEPFVTVLRAGGVSERSIATRHVLKNASIPAITLIGLTVGELLAGSVIAETIFSRTGLGFMTEQAVRAQDGPMVLAVVMFVAIVFTLVNLATDLVYPLIDRRISLTNASAARSSARQSTSGKSSESTEQSDQSRKVVAA
ncbi:ABC transporter permease [Agromyces intestinalis]|uniref:ABC transporter permease n=1 Tax=Agromyces intestinalis TaxID=2592652 RepID=A0A5C1YIZ7_9MICO|nr:ABC transporter permease [Agromyces intestinalis]